MWSKVLTAAFLLGSASAANLPTGIHLITADTVQWAWDRYPDPTVDGFVLHVAPDSIAFVALDTAQGGATTTLTRSVPTQPAYYYLTAFKGGQHSPPSNVVYYAPR